MKKNKCISYYFLIKCTAETFFSWLIYSHKLTTSKTFSFFPLFSYTQHTQHKKKKVYITFHPL
ncbi:hypothetical protein AWL05_14115 [Listeria monocytogenes]|nr:hypothetical protein AWL05_14115 [Listeria monocytogenes]